MFPSCGYFTNVPCPFFLNGLCERPYCHFRHSRHDVARAKENVATYASEVPTYSPTPIIGVTSNVSTAANSAIPDITGTEEYYTSASNDSSASTSHGEISVSIPSFTSCNKFAVPVADEEEAYVTISSENIKDTGQLSSRNFLAKVTDKEPAALPAYLPTPKTPSLPVAPAEKDDFGIPVYQPTPKQALKKHTYMEAKVESKSKKRKGTDLEYDPACNFSCIGLSHSSASVNNGASEYNPSKKVKSMPSPRDFPAYGDPDVDMENEEDAEPDGEFSADEEDCSKAEPNEDKPSAQNNFENICDDDISSDEESDDDFMDVPDLTLSADDLLKLRLSLKTEIKKSSKKNKDIKKSRKDEKKSSDKDRKGLSETSESRRSTKDTEKTEKKGSSEKSDPRKSSKDTKKTEKKGSSEKSEQRRSSKDSKSTASASSSSSQKSSSMHSSSSSKTSSSLNTEKSSKTVLSSFKPNKSQQKHSSKERDSTDTGSAELNSKSGLKLNSLSSAKKISGSVPSPSVKQPSSSDVKSLGTKSLSNSKHFDAGDKRQSSIGDKSLSQRKPSSGRASSDRKCSGRDEKKNASDKHSHSLVDRKSSTEQGERKSSTENKHSSSLSKSSDLGGKVSDSLSRKLSSTSKIESKHKSSHSESKHSKKPKAKSSSSNAGTDNGTSSSSHKMLGSGPSHKENKLQSKSVVKDDVVHQVFKLVNSDLFGEGESEDDHGDDVQLLDHSVKMRAAVNGPSTSCARQDEDDIDLTSFQDPTIAADDDTVESDVDYSTFINDSDLEDDDTFDECLRIFKEDLPQTKNKLPVKKTLVKDQKACLSGPKDDPLLTLPVSGKKRKAHTAAEKLRKPELLKKEKPRRMMSPMEVMHNRIMEMQRRALERAAAKLAVQEQVVTSTSGVSSASSSANKTQGLGLAEKKRVAHTPQTPGPPHPETQKTLAITASKTEKRTAHSPNLPNLKRPAIPASFGSKVPSNIRQRYLNLIIDECLKFLGEEQAYKKGLVEEAGVYERSSNKNIYLRVAVNTITRLRQEAKESQPGSSKSLRERSLSLSHAQSHEATLGGSRAAKTSFTLHRSTGSGKKVEVPLTAAELYQKLLKYALAEEQLVANGYPRPCPESAGKAVILQSKYQDKDSLLKSNERTCSRCGKRFIVKSDGTYAFPQECVYHWSRAYPRKKNGYIQHIYNCCSSDASSLGCQVAVTHVHEQNKRDSPTGFMRTIPRSPPRDGNYGVYALDCEMVYTLAGLELARVTVVDVEGATVFESLVKPASRIVDYNTRFSGLTEADLKDVEATITDIQAILLARFSANTILIGHSLESDFFALKLIHSTVVDTSVVFPHRLGPPFKRALKNLMLEIFQKLIQCDDGGHDSKEDAVACLQLMKWQIKEDSKRESRYT